MPDDGICFLKNLYEAHDFTAENLQRFFDLLHGRFEGLIQTYRAEFKLPAFFYSQKHLDIFIGQFFEMIIGEDTIEEALLRSENFEDFLSNIKDALDRLPALMANKEFIALYQVKLEDPDFIHFIESGTFSTDVIDNCTEPMKAFFSALIYFVRQISHEEAEAEELNDFQRAFEALWSVKSKKVSNVGDVSAAAVSVGQRPLSQVFEENFLQHTGAYYLASSLFRELTSDIYSSLLYADFETVIGLAQLCTEQLQSEDLAIEIAKMDAYFVKLLGYEAYVSLMAEGSYNQDTIFTFIQTYLQLKQQKIVVSMDDMIEQILKPLFEEAPLRYPHGNYSLKLRYKLEVLSDYLEEVTEGKTDLSVGLRASVLTHIATAYTSGPGATDANDDA